MYHSDYQCLTISFAILHFCKGTKDNGGQAEYKTKAPGTFACRGSLKGYAIGALSGLPSSLVPAGSAVPLEGAEILIPSLGGVFFVGKENGEGCIMVWVSKMAVAVAREYACPAACGVLVQENLVQCDLPFGKGCGVHRMENCDFHIETLWFQFGL